MQTIELDCPVGSPRPGDLIGGVIKDTDLKESQPVSTFFGNWTWEYNMSEEEWKKKIQPIIIPRITALYNSGAIRYGSW